MSVIIMARRLGLRKSHGSEVGFCPWSDDEWALLEKNMPLVAEQQAVLFPDRAKRAVEKAREPFKSKKSRTGLAMDK